MTDLVIIQPSFVCYFICNSITSAINTFTQVGLNLDDIYVYTYNPIDYLEYEVLNEIS